MAMNRLSMVLTEQDCIMLKLISGGQVTAIAEFKPYLERLEATRLIVTNREGKLQLTQLGQTVLDRGSHALH
jgi:hypothetical protein